MEDFFTPMPRALAHRGDSWNYPENTEPAFRAALDLGVDVIETDAHLTADGEVVLWHDDTLERVTGDSRKISGITAEDLKKIDAGARFTRDRGQTYPFRNKGIHPLLLKECLRMFPKTRFNIDLKDNLPDLAEAVAQILREEKAEKRVCVGSFHHRVLKKFRRVSPDTETSLSKREVRWTVILHRLGGSIKVVRKGKVRVIQMPEYSGRIRLITNRFIRWSRNQRVIVQVWTVNDPREMDRLFQTGVDGLFSDNAEAVVSAARRAAAL